MIRLLATLATGAALALAMSPPVTAAEVASGRSYTVTDLLRMEGFGQAALDPGERRLVFERRAAFGSGPAFDHDFFNTIERTDLFVADLGPGGTQGPARRLLDPAEGRGQVMGPWSPSGDRLLIYRARADVWEAGVVEMATGAVRWLGIAPEPPGWGRNVQWLSEDVIVMVARADGQTPWRLRAPADAQARLPVLWARQRQGSVATGVQIGSGAFAGRTPADSDKQLLRVGLSTGDIAVLAAGQIFDIEASPDRRRVAVALFGAFAPGDPNGPFLQGELPYRRTLAVIDAANGERWDPLEGRDLMPNLLSWSEGTGELLVWAREHGDWADGALIRVDPVGRRVRPVAMPGLKPVLRETGLRTSVVTAAWLGDTPVVYARPEAGRPDWYPLSGSRPEPLTAALGAAPTRLAAIAAGQAIVVADGAVWRLANGEDPQRLSRPGGSVEWLQRRPADLGQRFGYNPATPADSVAFRQDGQAYRVSSDGRVEAFGMAAPGARAVAIGDRVSAWMAVDDHYRESLSLGDGPAAEPLARINDHYADIAFPRPRPVAHRGPSGEALTSWLYLPVRPVATPPPLVVIPYPGASNPVPDSAAEPTLTNTAISVPVLLGAGYAVLVPSLPRDAFAEPAEGLADQILAVVDAAAPGCECDTRRLVLWGHSFGAHAALVTATQTPRFSAIVAANGLYDMAGAWGGFAPMSQKVSPENGLTIHSRAGWVETGQGALGGPPWSDPDRYRRNSPLYQADRITTPVMLISADLDYVPPAQAEAMFSALYRQNKDAVLLTYYGEGHVFGSPANVRDMMTSALDWIAEVLASTPPRADPGGRRG